MRPSTTLRCRFAEPQGRLLPSRWPLRPALERYHRPITPPAATAARAAARDAVRPIVQTYKTGETIVPAGKIITPADLEAFQQLGMISPGQRWEDMLGAAAVVILSAVFIPMYFYRRKRAP